MGRLNSTPNPCIRHVLAVLLITTLLGSIAAYGSLPSPRTTSGASAPVTSTDISSPSNPSTDLSPSTETRLTAELHVFAAASLAQAFDEIGQNFEAAHPGVRVQFNFAGSQHLAQQIEHGAPADVFASAHPSVMEQIIQAGHVISGTQQTFVRNHLVVIYPQSNPTQIEHLRDLAKPGIKLDLAAKEVPVGRYTFDMLDRASQDEAYGSMFIDNVLNNVVSYEDNVRAVLNKVALGEADAGIVYASDVGSDAANPIGSIDIPDPFNIVATYPIAPIKSSPNAEVAQQFIDYVQSDGGQAILARYNFEPVTP